MVIQKSPTVITSAPTASSQDKISINMLPQDPMISQPEIVQFDKVQFGQQLSGPRLHTQDSVAVAQADAQGNYLVEIGSPQFDQVNTHGIVAGNITEVLVPVTQLLSPRRQDQQGLSALQLNGPLARIGATPEYSIVVR